MIYLQITSGRGPAECEVAIQHILVRMALDIPKNRFHVCHVRPGSAIVSFLDDDADYAKAWIGTILWVCQSPIRKNHRRKNWFVGIREVHLPGNDEVVIRDQDLVYETRKASSKGGQNANKVSSLVRLTHTITGITVIAEDERSQKQNKAIALGRLREALHKRRDDAIAAIQFDNWTQHNQLERGNPTRTFEGPHFAERT